MESHFWEIPLFGSTLHLSTLLMVWAGMLVTLFLASRMARGAQLVPGSWQVAGEGIVGFVRDMTFSASGPYGDKYLFIVGSLFLFVLIANLMGQLPLRLVPLPQGELIAATGDINTTLGLALVTLTAYVGLSLKELGLGGFIGHHLQPMWFTFPLHLIDYITRPGSLMLRLYANILVGEILTGVALKFAPIVVPTFVIFMELFVALLQAFIFALLSTIYISLMTAHDHDDGHGHEAAVAPVHAH